MKTGGDEVAYRSNNGLTNRLLQSYSVSNTGGFSS